MVWSFLLAETVEKLSRNCIAPTSTCSWELLNFPPSLKCQLHLAPPKRCKKSFGFFQYSGNLSDHPCILIYRQHQTEGIPQIKLLLSSKVVNVFNTCKSSVSCSFQMCFCVLLLYHFNISLTEKTKKSGKRSGI